MRARSIATSVYPEELFNSFIVTVGGIKLTSMSRSSESAAIDTQTGKTLWKSGEGGLRRQGGDRLTGFKRSDDCPFIPGRLYTAPDGARLQFRGHVFSAYDGVHSVEFFDLETRQHSALQVKRWSELSTCRLVAPGMPLAAGWRLRGHLKHLLSPNAAARAQATHDIANLEEQAIPALPWLLETAHFDDIGIYDDQDRKTNPRAQARHALERLARSAIVDEAIRRLPPVVDPDVRPPTPKEAWPRLP